MRSRLDMMDYSGPRPEHLIERAEEPVGAPVPACAGRACQPQARRARFAAAGGASEEEPVSTQDVEQFPSETVGLPPCGRPETVELEDGEAFDLGIAPVVKRLGEDEVRMLAYNGSVPGPVLKVREGSHVVVNVENQGDLETTVHWHGIRLDNRYDGTHATQEPIAIGKRFEYRLEFPDAGAYWYHPHVRQDYGQEMGLYGTILVVPEDPDYWPPAHRELMVTLDDVLIEHGRIAPFDPRQTTYSAMGRFGNRMLINGDPEMHISARRGEVVRFYLTNTANTRVFNFAIRNARMKLVGGDSGRCEHEEFVESVIVSPSERVVVDALFEAPGTAALEHRTPEQVYRLGAVEVVDESAEAGPAHAFGELRTNAEMTGERDRIAPYLEAPPDKTLALVAEMDFETPEGAIEYFCPMHPEVVSDQPGKCPKCAMKLMPRAAAVVYTCPMHPEVVSDEPGKCPKCAMKLMPVARSRVEGIAQEQPAAPHAHAEGEEHGHAAGAIEWEDDMVEVNKGTTPANTRWKLIDRDTGAAGMDIDWRFTVGDQVKIRLVNEMESDHPMHHPFHIHGAGRFLVLARDGVVEPNLVWTDTVLITPGQELDLLLDVTHPGIWMAHCHIAEHHESGMVFSFEVAPRNGG
jgi:FtsP/CotA-like multicopper oxidase with cupredoxin domain